MYFEQWIFIHNLAGITAFVHLHYENITLVFFLIEVLPFTVEVQ